MSKTMKIKVTTAQAVEMLAASGAAALHRKELAKQSDEWLALYWQLLNDAQKTRVAEFYLRKTEA